MEKAKSLLKIVSVPLTLLVIYVSLSLFWKLFDLPPQDELLALIKSYFALYGLPFLLICAILEGFFVFGSYFPGGVIIFLSVILAGQDIPKIITNNILSNFGVYDFVYTELLPRKIRLV